MHDLGKPARYSKIFIVTSTQLIAVLSLVQNAPQSEELTAAILKLAAEEAKSSDPNYEQEREIARINQLSFREGKKSVSTDIKFSKKDVDTMAKTFKKEFIANGMAAKIIKRESGRNTYYYEIRYRRNGYNISVCHKDIKMAKQMFLQATKNIASPEDIAKNKLKFGIIAADWLKYKHGKVAEETWKGYESEIRRFIPEDFKQKAISDVSTKILDELMQSLETPRQYEDMRTIFNGVFKFAKASGIITHNPVEMIPFKRAERENRDRLSDEQIIFFLTSLRDPFYKPIRNFAYAMYFFGLRPCELDDEAHFENGFIICRNRKRKNGKKAYKKIPIPRQAKDLFDYNAPLKSPLSYDRTLDIMKSALGEGAVPYQLRHTFSSLCYEGTKNQTLVDTWMGDSPETLVGKTYIHFSDKYMISEMEKVQFIIP